MIAQIQGWWRRHVTLRNSKRSSGHLDASARSAAFHKARRRRRV